MGLVKRSFSLAGHRTSVALEAEFWAALLVLAGQRGVSLAALVASVDAGRGEGRALASALRVAALSGGGGQGGVASLDPPPGGPASWTSAGD